MRGDQISLGILKSEIDKSKDKLSFIKQRVAGSEKAKWYLVQVDMYQLDPVTMGYYEVYRFQWYVRYHKDCTKCPILECRFWPEVR